MSTKKELKLLTELLNLEGIKVLSHRQYEGIGIILQLEASGKESICSRCGSKSNKLHQNRWHIIKDLSWGERAVFLEINRRQFKCEKCQKPFSEEMGFVKERRTYTKRLAVKIVEEVLADDISSIAKKGLVTTEEIERMLKDASANLLELKPVGLKRLGIDEIALVKGQGKYCAVLVDIDRSKLLMILESRTKEELKKVLLGWGEEVLGGIEEVSIDLWKGYKSLVTEIMPKAQVVADRFHKMSLFFMLDFSGVINCNPLFNNSSNSSFLIYPLSPNIFPDIPCVIDDKCVRSSTLPGVILQLNISPQSLIIK